MNQANIVCLICGKEISIASQEYSDVCLADGTVFYGHNKCINALSALISTKSPLPVKTEETCSGLVHTLFLENWFSESRSLNDVSEKIKQMGYNYSSARISNVLRDLTKRKVLTRQGRTGHYSYIQKKPPPF